MEAPSGVPVNRAAARLGVSPRRVLAMIRDERLVASKEGGVWLVDSQSVEGRRRGKPQGGRPLNPRNAWALLWLASGSPELRAMVGDWVSPWMCWYLLDKLKNQGWSSLAPRLRNRASIKRFRCHPSDLRRIDTEPRVVRSGVSAARDHGLDISDPEILEAYVPAGRLPLLTRKYSLAPSEQPNVILHVTEDPWPFPRGWKVAPPILAALDLLEAGDTRSRRAAMTVLNRWNAA